MPVPRNTVDELEALEQLVTNVLADLDRIRKQGKPGITRAVRRLHQVRARLLALKIALEVCPECGCGYECGCVPAETYPLLQARMDEVEAARKEARVDRA